MCLLGCSPVAQGINQQSKGGCRLPTAWIIEVVSRERRAPGCEHPDEIAVVEVSLHLLFGEVHANPKPAAVALSISAEVLKTSWPSTRTLSSRPPFSNSQTYSP